MIGRVLFIGKVSVGVVGRNSGVSGLTVGGQRRSRVSVYSVCRSYNGSTGEARRGLGIIGGQRDLGG